MRKFYDKYLPYLQFVIVVKTSHLLRSLLFLDWGHIWVEFAAALGIYDEREKGKRKKKEKF